MTASASSDRRPGCLAYTKAETGKLETALWIEALLSGGEWLLWVSEGGVTGDAAEMGGGEGKLLDSLQPQSDPI